MAKVVNTTLSKEKLEKLKKNLPKGFRELVAEKLDLSISYVNMVLAGTRKNSEILRLAIEAAIQNKKCTDEMIKQIKKL